MQAPGPGPEPGPGALSYLKPDVKSELLTTTGSIHDQSIHRKRVVGWSVRKIRGVTSGTFGSTMLRCRCEADTNVEVDSDAHRHHDLRAQAKTR